VDTQAAKDSQVVLVTQEAVERASMDTQVVEDLLEA
jgi:hypothetical protein